MTDKPTVSSPQTPLDLQEIEKRLGIIKASGSLSLAKDFCEQNADSLVAEVKRGRRIEVERVAEAIYDTMRENDREGKNHPWVLNGNSLKQDEARRKAREYCEKWAREDSL